MSAVEDKVRRRLREDLSQVQAEVDSLRKVQEELASVVSADRLPSMEDMPHLPYTRATIYEVMRRSTVVPLGTTHRTIRCVGRHIVPVTPD